jgi:hypothetical protein
VLHAADSQQPVQIRCTEGVGRGLEHCRFAVARLQAVDQPDVAEQRIEGGPGVWSHGV